MIDAEPCPATQSVGKLVRIYSLLMRPSGMSLSHFVKPGEMVRMVRFPADAAESDPRP